MVFAQLQQALLRHAQEGDGDPTAGHGGPWPVSGKNALQAWKADVNLGDIVFVRQGDQLPAR